jgi:hypothetical protein
MLILLHHAAVQTATLETLPEMPPPALSPQEKSCDSSFAHSYKLPIIEIEEPGL